MSAVNLKDFLDILLDVEGKEFHRVKGEPDITSPCGIYKGKHPEARVFKVIEDLAKGMGLKTDTTKWTDTELDLINKEFNLKGIVYKQVMKAIEEFYTEYIKGAKADQLPSIMIYPYVNIYTNSSSLAGRSLQEAIVTIQKATNDQNVIKVDGLPGTNTFNALNRVLEKVSDVEFVYLFLLKVKTEYIELSTDNGKEDKHLPYLKGWDNRVNDIVNYLIKNRRS